MNKDGQEVRHQLLGELGEQHFRRKEEQVQAPGGACLLPLEQTARPVAAQNKQLGARGKDPGVTITSPRGLFSIWRVTGTAWKGYEEEQEQDMTWVFNRDTGCWREGRSRWMCFLALWAGCVRGHSGNPHRLLLIGEGLSEAPDPPKAQCPVL